MFLFSFIHCLCSGKVHTWMSPDLTCRCATNSEQRTGKRGKLQTSVQKEPTAQHTPRKQNLVRVLQAASVERVRRRMWVTNLRLT